MLSYDVPRHVQFAIPANGGLLSGTRNRFFVASVNSFNAHTMQNQDYTATGKLENRRCQRRLCHWIQTNKQHRNLEGRRWQTKNSSPQPRRPQVPAKNSWPQPRRPQVKGETWWNKFEKHWVKSVAVLVEKNLGAEIKHSTRPAFHRIYMLESNVAGIKCWKVVVPPSLFEVPCLAALDNLKHGNSNYITIIYVAGLSKSQKLKPFLNRHILLTKFFQPT